MRNNWHILLHFLKERFTKPLNQPSFVFYFFVVIFLLGSIGLISEIIFQYCEKVFNSSILVTNSANTFLTLIAASSIELIMINDDNLNYPYRKNDIQIFGVSVLIFGFLLWIFSIYIKDSIGGLISSILGLILAYLLWWIANSNNKTLVSDEQPDVAIGGNKQNIANDNLEGDIDEFTN